MSERDDAGYELERVLASYDPFQDFAGKLYVRMLLSGPTGSETADVFITSSTLRDDVRYALRGITKGLIPTNAEIDGFLGMLRSKARRQKLRAARPFARQVFEESTLAKLLIEVAVRGFHGSASELHAKVVRLAAKQGREAELLREARTEDALGKQLVELTSAMNDLGVIVKRATNARPRAWLITMKDGSSQINADTLSVDTITKVSAPSRSTEDTCDDSDTPTPVLKVQACDERASEPTDDELTALLRGKSIG